MGHTVDVERLKRTFMRLASLESPSRKEGRLAAHLADLFSRELGAEVFHDSSQRETGSEAGNLVVRIPGRRTATPLFFNAHMDTVEPCKGVKVVFEHGVFHSDGTTVLGADDKAAIAILVEVARLLEEEGVSHGPIEYVFTVCEEVGLLGAKAFDPSLIQARAGYALDTVDPDVLINQAPAATRFRIKVLGRASHAGLNPEQGIHAIRIAAEAICRIPLGRLDEDTTANIGVIHGGKATNIVPEEVEVQGEVRSHDEKRLQEVQDGILSAFHGVVQAHRPPPHEMATRTGKALPVAQAVVFNDYPRMHVDEAHPLVVSALDAARALGRDLRVEKSGGGSDANVFNGKGLATVIMGIGMQKVHTTEEFIRLDDMVSTVQLVMEIIKRWD